MNPVVIGENDKKKRTLGGLPYPVPLGRRCSATNRKGERCGAWSVKGKTVCKSHGGKSTGPKTADGKKRLAEARTITGKHSLDALKSRLLARMQEAFATGFDDPIRETITPEQFASFRASAWTGYLRPKVLAMDWAEFRTMRKHMAAFARGEIGFLEMARQLDGPKGPRRRPRK